MADISSPGSPTVIGSCTASSPGGSMAVRGDYVYFSSGWSHIGVIDVGDPQNPVKGQDLDLGEAVTADVFTIKDDLLYVQGVQNAEGMFLVYRLTDLLAPVPVGALAVGSQRSSGLHASGNLVYSAAGNNGVGVVDVSDPEHPALRALFNLTEEEKTYPAQDVYASGNLVYVTAGAGGVLVYNLRDPLQPQRIGIVSMEDAFRIDGSGGTVAALSGGDVALHLIGSSGEAPVSKGQAASPQIASGVFSAGDMLYAGTAQHLWIYNSEDPASPRIVHRDDRWTNFIPLAATATQLVGISGNNSVWDPVIDRFNVIDVTNPAEPEPIGN